MSGWITKRLIVGLAASVVVCGAARASVFTFEAPVDASQQVDASGPVDGLTFYDVPLSSADALAQPSVVNPTLDDLTTLAPLTLDTPARDLPQAPKRGHAALDQLPLLDPHAPFLPKAAAWLLLIAGLIGSRAMLRRARQLALAEA